MTRLLPPSELLALVETSIDELVSQLRATDLARYPQPSSLPGWSTAQLVAHLHSLARAAVRQFEHAGSENPPEMYDGGMAGRVEAINMTALMRPEKLAELTIESLGALRESLPGLEERWEQPVGYRPSATVADMVYAVWREMLIHATDLDASVRPAASWPQAFTDHLLRALKARVAPGDRIVLQPHGKQPIVLGGGDRSWVLTGTDYDLAAWLAGRPSTGVVQATAAADSADFPNLDPWPSTVLMDR
ncbi:maleylpyruvate isomerase family mycothiol-dependent enzyme [Glutamicibacter endophyticus]|uniref:maleylpyruvate isomerase family mycothiol-dependent enzyme n=1 Tax=Glutamicibacter endophyticus TaxID=1522174 RepID=UPI003AF08048